MNGQADLGTLGILGFHGQAELGTLEIQNACVGIPALTHPKYNFHALPRLAESQFVLLPNSVLSTPAGMYMGSTSALEGLNE